MTSRIVYIVAVLHLLQCVSAADPQDLPTSAERTAQTVQQNITNAAIRAENIIRTANAQASLLVDSTLTGIQKLTQNVGARIQTLVQAGRNFRTCVSEQSEAVRRIVPVAGQELRACADTAIQPLRAYSADIQDLGSQALQLVLRIPSQVTSCAFTGLGLFSCLGTALEYTTSRGLLLVSSSSYDLTRVTALAVQLPGKLAACASSQIAKAVTELSAIGASIDACVRNSSSLIGA